MRVIIIMDYISRNVHPEHRAIVTLHATSLYNHVVAWLNDTATTSFVVHALAGGFVFSLSERLDSTELFWKQRLRLHYKERTIPRKVDGAVEYTASNTPIKSVTEDMITQMYKLSHLHNDRKL